MNTDSIKVRDDAKEVKEGALGENPCRFVIPHHTSALTEFINISAK